MKTVFKVKYGYGSTEFILVNSLDEVAKALYAKAEKIGVTIGGKFISGQEIKSIEPDIHSYTGWYRTYEPESPDDYKQIERDVPKEIFQLMEAVSKRVHQQISSGAVHRIGNEGLTPQILLTESEKPELPARSAFQLAPKTF
jgi:hypothetical protein